MGLAGPRKVLGLAKGFKFRTSNFMRLDSALIPSLLARSRCNTRSVASSSSFGAFRYCVLSVPLVVCAFFPSLDAAPFLFSPPPCNDTKYCVRLFCSMCFCAECCWFLYSGNWCCGVDNSSGNGELRDCIAVRDCQRQRDKRESGGRKRREGGYGGHAMAMAGSATCPSTRASYQLSVSYSCSRKGRNRLGSHAWLLGLRRQRSRFLFPRLSLCMACFSQVPILQPVVRTVLGEKFLFRLLESDRVAQSESLCALFTWMDTFDSFYSLFFVCSQCLALSRVRC